MKTVTVEKMVFGGFGFVRTGEGVLLSKMACLERCWKWFRSQKHDCTVARSVKIINQSQFRRESPCRHAGEWGCDWLFIQYPGQLQLKKEIFIDCLKRIGKLESFPEPEIYASRNLIIGSEPRLRWGRTGFAVFRRKTNDIVPIEHCPLLCDQINGLLKTISGKPEYISGGNLKVISGDDGLTSDPLLPSLPKV